MSIKAKKKRRKGKPAIESLESVRRDIDKLDRRLVDFLNQRAHLVEKIRRLKKRQKLAIRDSRREQAVLENVRGHNEGPLPDSVVQEMFSRLIDGYRRWEARSSHSAAASSAAKELRGLKVGIFGFGLMGASLVLALKKNVRGVTFIACDPKTPEASPASAALKSFENSPDKILTADILILSAPVGAILDFIQDFGPRIKDGTLVLDLASTKKKICDAASRKINPRATFVGGHPLAGKEVSGASHADADLFVDRPFVLSMTRPVNPASAASPAIEEALSRVTALVTAIGAKPVRLSPSEHDQILAVTSHLPQMIATSLALTALETRGRAPDHFVSGPALKDMTRLACSDYAMWRDIARTNAAEIERAIDQFSIHLAEIRARISAGDFEIEFQNAKELLGATQC